MSLIIEIIDILKDRFECFCKIVFDVTSIVKLSNIPHRFTWMFVSAHLSLNLQLISVNVS